MSQPTPVNGLMPRLKRRWLRTPAPAWLTSTYLSLRWHCRVSPAASIQFPFNVRIGKNATLGRCTIIASGRGITLASCVEIHDGAVLDAQRGTISIGEHSAIGPYVVIYGEGTVTLRNYVAIATHSTIVSANHKFADREQFIRLQGATAVGIVVEDDVWIAANCVILDGVTIEKGSVVAAGAVVNRDVPAYTIMGGVPAKPIGTR